MTAGQWQALWPERPAQRGSRQCLAGGLLVFAVLCSQAAAITRGTDADLLQLGLQDLMQVDVTSVSRHAEPAATAAAAVFVLPGEEIRHSGVRSIAEALRLVPGLEVAQSDAHTYAISARGFNGTSADKLEVLLDGRSVYTPLTSAVFWDTLDTYLPDIDRIEVIRGPGAALWGANAVNGVINIVTRSAHDSQGASAEAYAGNEERYGAAARYGFALAAGTELRFYAKTQARRDEKLESGIDAADGIHLTQGGFRLDSAGASGDVATLSGDFYQGYEHGPQALGPRTNYHLDGGNLLARYTCCARDNGRWSLQAYYDGYLRQEPTIYSEHRSTEALEFQQQWQLGAANTLVYGADLKNSRDETGGPAYAILFDPAARSLDTYGAYLQDQSSWLDNRATLTVGTRADHNSFSGFELQPTARFGYALNPQWYAWTAVSRAVRTPNRIDSDIAVYCPPPNGFPGTCGPGLFRVGNPGQQSEELVAYEGGTRLRAGNSLSFDLTGYFNDYTRIRSQERTPPFGTFANNLAARGAGGTLSAFWQPSPAYSMRAWFSVLELAARRAAGNDGSTIAQLEGSDPRQQAGLSVDYRPTTRWSLRGDLRYVAALDYYRVPAYAELSLDTIYRLAGPMTIALKGDNLLHSRHAEFGDSLSRSALRRSLFVELAWNAY
jgi:iron complex outermembrane receptor protein